VTTSPLGDGIKAMLWKNTVVRSKAAAEKAAWLFAA
jgi:hypothetical protein